MEAECPYKISGANGCQTYGPVTIDKTGNLYGATYEGGKNNAGTVFELTLNAKGHYAFQTLYNFKGGTDGSNPLFMVVVLDTSGNIHGTTYDGGKSALGTVFEVSP
jgi:uncharacterized repeat protein (TIGR03803 family)